MSDVRRIKRWRTEIGTDDTEFVTLPASDYDALAARLAEVEAAGVRYTTMTDKNLDRLAAKLEAAEARVRELEPDAERYRWLRDRWFIEGGLFPWKGLDLHHDGFPPISHFDEAIDAARASDSARAVQEPACQHDLQQPEPTVRVWHSMFEPDKQSAECNVCGSRWTIKGVGRG